MSDRYQIRATPKVISDLNGYVGSDDNWRDLDELVTELFQNPIDDAGLDALFKVFERHPTHDGYEVFWSILHGIESVAGYEPHLLQSLRRCPSLFAVHMVNRILNAGARDVSGVSWVSVLLGVASHGEVDSEIRDAAEKYLRRHDR
jgi:hypothetical protein